MNFAQAQQGINHAISLLSSVTQIENIEFRNNERIISWIGRLPGISRDTYYALEYQSLLDRQQYSVLLSDGSYFQFFYEFDDADNLKFGRLAYYPRPVETRDELELIEDAAEGAADRDDDNLFNHLHCWTELIDAGLAKPANTSHLRLDFDKSAKSHSVAHLQFGATQNFRVPADFFPQPIAFIQLCRSLLPQCDEASQPHLQFSQNHSLRLARDKGLISLGSL
jgi:hypothetical protein